MCIISGYKVLSELKAGIKEICMDNTNLTLVWFAMITPHKFIALFSMIRNVTPKKVIMVFFIDHLCCSDRVIQGWIILEQISSGKHR